MLITLLLFLIFAACIGFCYADGMWTNALRLVNVVTAGLLAMNFYEPVAIRIDAWQPSYTYFWDFLSLWFLFAVFLSVLRTVTDTASKVKVRFLKLADHIGSAFFAACVGGVMVCFTATSLHTAPLAKNFLFGSFHPEARAKSMFSPEIIWLGFTQNMSRGTYCRSTSEQDWKAEKTVFDPQGEFLPKYATRRANLEAHMAATGSLRVAP